MRRRRENSAERADCGVACNSLALRFGPILMLASALAGCTSARQSPRLAFSASEIEAVDVAFPSRAIDVRSSDARAIHCLLESLAAARVHPDHKCESIGGLTLRMRSGQREEFRLLAGHDRDSYEFRHHDNLYRTPRAQFAAALREIGVISVPD